MRAPVNVDDEVLVAAKATTKAARGRHRAFDASDALFETREKPHQSRNGIDLLPTRGVMVTSEQVYRLLDGDAA